MKPLAKKLQRANHNQRKVIMKATSKKMGHDQSNCWVGRFYNAGSGASDFKSILSEVLKNG